MIRAMRDGDAEAVAALIRGAFGSIAVPLDPAPSALRMTAVEVLVAEGGAVWDESGVRGCVLWRMRDGGLYVGRLATAPGWTRRGIGRALLLAAEQEAGRLGVGRLWAEVRLAMSGNRRLFAAAGFREGCQRCHPGYSAPTFVEVDKLLA